MFYVGAERWKLFWGWTVHSILLGKRHNFFNNFVSRFHYGIATLFSLCLPVSLSLSALILMIILVHVRRDGSFQTQPCIHAHLHMSYIPLIHNNKKEDEEKIHYSELWKLFKHIFMWVKKYWQKALQMFKECLKQAKFQETFIYFLDIRTRYNGIIPDNFIVYRSFFSPSRYLETATY